MDSTYIFLQHVLYIKLLQSEKNRVTGTFKLEGGGTSLLEKKTIECRMGECWKCSQIAVKTKTSYETVILPKINCLLYNLHRQPTQSDKIRNL